jgi:hypothetical protein
MNKQYDKFLRKALDKMFQAVGFENFDSQSIDQKDWYSKKTWTQEQSKEFKKWFISEGKKDLKFTKQMMEKEYDWFDLKWGWKNPFD